MQAIILAAGMGKRLGELTQNNTKCMVKVNGVSLIDRTLTQLSQLNLKRVVIVIGYKGDNLRQYIGDEYKGLKIEYIENPVYDKTNNIYSLSLAEKELQEDDTLLIESDLIFEDSLLSYITENPYPNLALVAKAESWMDGTMVRIDEHQNIINFIPKKAFRFSDIDSYYKTVNVYKFSKEFSAHSYVPFLEAYTKALGNNEYYEQVLRVITLLDHCELKALPLTGQKWYEIDDVQDLDIAGTIFASPEEKLEKYQKRYGGYWRYPSLLDFCYLVNPYFPPQKLKEEVKANFDTLLSEYPSGAGVNNLLAGKYFGIDPSYVCVGNGAAELIKSLVSYLSGNMGVVYPTFEEYPNRVKSQHVIKFIPGNPNFSYTSHDLIAYFSDKALSSLLLINPDNPSGNYLIARDVKTLLEWSKETSVRLIVDESFLDFATDGLQSTLLHNSILEQYPHLVVLKSISKSYGVPGLRLGVLATADVELMQYIKKDVSIWNINSFAEFYMQIFGKYESCYKNAVKDFLKERARFETDLKAIPFLRVIPSEANYFLCEVTQTYTSKKLVEKLLVDYNILLKDCSTKKGFEGSNYVRIAIRDSQDNNRLLSALQQL